MLLVFLFMITSVFAQNPYQTKLTGFMPICDGSKIELSNLPPGRDQGRYGLCYAHSSILLLEHLRCSNNPNPKLCYANQGSVLHLARYHNTLSENKIKIGGDPRYILSRFATERKLAKETCAEYEDWKNLDGLYRSERIKIISTAEEKNEVDFFYYISQQIKQNKATQDDLVCWANDMINAGMGQNMQDIMGILSKAKDSDWQELRYQLLVPKSCFSDSIQYPEYSVKIFPEAGEQKTFKGFRNFIFRALSAGVPVEASFQSRVDASGGSIYHSVAIVGQRHVCDQKRCELQFKIQNSYGRSWQDMNDDGWVNAQNLTDLMAGPGLGVTAIFPKGKELNLSLTAPYYENSPAKTKPGPSSGEDCWTGDKPRPTSTPQNSGERGLWKCVKDGLISFGDFAVAGADCKRLK